MKNINLPCVPTQFSVMRNRNMVLYIIALLRLFHDLYLSEQDIDLEYNDFYKQYKLSVFKNCITGPGHSAHESRDRAWERTQNAIEDLFNIVDKRISWRWIDTSFTRYSQTAVYDTPAPNQIPGFAYWIPEDPPDNSILA